MKEFVKKIAHNERPTKEDPGVIMLEPPEIQKNVNNITYIYISSTTSHLDINILSILHYLGSPLG